MTTPTGDTTTDGGVASTTTEAEPVDVIECPVTPVMVASNETTAFPEVAPAVNDTTTVALCPAASASEVCDGEHPLTPAVQLAVSA